MEKYLDALIQGEDGLVTTVYLKVPQDTLFALAITGLGTAAAAKIIFVFLDKVFK